MMYATHGSRAITYRVDLSLTKSSGVQVQEAFPEDPWFQHEWGEILVLQNRHKDASRHFQAAAALFASQLEKVCHPTWQSLSCSVMKAWLVLCAKLWHEHCKLLLLQLKQALSAQGETGHVLHF